MPRKNKPQKPIKYGIFGVGNVAGGGRGRSFTGTAAEAAGFKLVALCDKNKEAVEKAAADYDTAAYTDFEQFIEHDMEAVVLANYFHEHAPFAIMALNRGLHVMSECSACHTLGEGVELIRAVEKTGKIYMFAENYAYTPARQEMRRVFQTGELGTFMYGEGEYIHAMDANDGNYLSPGPRHWRNWIPSTYYCTHSLSPIMFITDTWPEKVNAFPIRKPADDPCTAIRAKLGDAASMIALRMDNGAVVKLLQVGLRGHGGPTRIHCARGAINSHGGQVSIAREQYHEELRHPKSISYTPNLPLGEIAAKSGHGGGDFWMMYKFGEAIRNEEQPFMNVYRGVAMSIVGIQAWRSALNDSNTVTIPDFRSEAVRKEFESDQWSPDPERYVPGQPPSNIDNIREIPPETLKIAEPVWREAGYVPSNAGEH